MNIRRVIEHDNVSKYAHSLIVGTRCDAKICCARRTTACDVPYLFYTHKYKPMTTPFTASATSVRNRPQFITIALLRAIPGRFDSSRRARLRFFFLRSEKPAVREISNTRRPRRSVVGLYGHHRISATNTRNCYRTISRRTQ